MTITADQVTEAYVKLRDERSEAKREFEAADAERKVKMERLEAWLLTALTTLGADSLKTSAGTAYISQRDRATCADWGLFWNWIASEGRLDMLEKRVSTKPVAEFLQEMGELPPGISISTEKTITVRRG